MPERLRYWRALASSQKASEDRAEVLERGDDLVVVVADGAGGMRGGALASETLVETARAVVANATLDARDTSLWTALFEELDRALSGKMTGETTGVVLVAGPSGIAGVCAGDSEAWIVERTSVDVLTADATRHRLGSGRAGPVSFHRPGLDGVLVVATDGLFKYASAQQIVGAVHTGNVACAAARLVALVRLPSGELHDDVGVVVVSLP